MHDPLPLSCLAVTYLHPVVSPIQVLFCFAVTRFEGPANLVLQRALLLWYRALEHVAVVQLRLHDPLLHHRLHLL